MDSQFRLSCPYEPTGHQPQAIAGLVEGLRAGARHQTLLGITGSGKTFTMASVIAQVNRPTLVLSPNKTLAAQLYGEFKELFPDNAVEYFVSYYDYYQPEAYVPSTDTFIEKDASRNENIERLRNSATRSLLDRRDVILVASVSCIYGLGSPSNYSGMSLELAVGQEIARDDLLRRLTQMQYARNNIDFRRGTFRVRGDVVEIFPAYEEDRVLRVEFFGDEIEALVEVNPLLGEVLGEARAMVVYPANHYVTPQDRIERAVPLIDAELEARLTELHSQGKLLEAQRLEQALRVQELRVFGYRLALTLPLLALAGWLFARQRQSRWWPFVWGFILFAVFVFFVELVPYLPSYGGYVRYTVGIVATVLVGRWAIVALQRYLERQRAAEAQPDAQRRAELGYDTALARLAKGVCPGCERTVDLKDGRTDFCPHCGIGLFDRCGHCQARKSAFARFCPACGSSAASPSPAATAPQHS